MRTTQAGEVYKANTHYFVSKIYSINAVIIVGLILFATSPFWLNVLLFPHSNCYRKRFQNNVQV